MGARKPGHPGRALLLEHDISGEAASAAGSLIRAGAPPRISLNAHGARAPNARVPPTPRDDRARPPAAPRAIAYPAAPPPAAPAPAPPARSPPPAGTAPPGSRSRARPHTS